MSPKTTKKAPAKKEPSAEAEEHATLSKRYDKLMSGLEKEYKKLVEKIKEAQEDGDETETAEVIRAGAVDFLRGCAEKLQAAEEVAADAKAMIDAVKNELTKLDRSREDLEERSNKLHGEVVKLQTLTEQLGKLEAGAERAVKQAKSV